MMTPPTNNNPFAQMLVAQQRAASFHQMLLQQQNHHNNTMNPLRPPPPNPSSNPQTLMQMYNQERPGPLNYLQGLAGDRPPLQPPLPNPGSVLGSLGPGPATLIRPQAPSFLNLSTLLQQQQQAAAMNNNASTPSSSSAPVTPVMAHTPMQTSPCTSSAPGPSAGPSTPNTTKVYTSGKRIGRPPGSFKKHVFDLGLTQNPVISKEGRDSPGEKVDIESMEDHECGWMHCDQIFSTRQALIEHFRGSHEPDIQQQFKAIIDDSTGQPDRIWFCRWKGCERTEPFKASYMLIVHVRRHTGEKPNRCPYTDCKKAYSRLENLKTHIRTHTGEKPYHCEFPGCTKAFSNASDRAKHQNRTHSDEKPYACTVENCNKSYTDPSSLRKHIKTVHGDDEYEKAKKNKPPNPGGRRKKHQSAVTVNNPMGFLNRQQFIQQQMAMIAFQEAMRLNMGGIQQQQMQQHQQQQNAAQPSPSSCTPVLPPSSHGTPDGGAGSSRGGSVPANSPAGSFTSSLSSEGSASTGSGRHSRGGGLIFSVENILKFSSFYGPLIDRIGFTKHNLTGITSMLRSVMNGRYRDLRRDRNMERTSIDGTAAGRRSFPMSHHPPEPHSNHDDIPQEPDDDAHQFHHGGGMCATLQLRSRQVKPGVLKNAQANAGVGFDSAFVSDPVEPSPADDVPLDQHLAGALQYVDSQRLAGVNPANVDVPYALTNFAERLHDGSLLIDSDDESDDSFACRSVDSAIPHCLQTSFTSGEDVDFNDFPPLNPQLTNLMPLMEPYAPRYLPDNTHSVDTNHVPLQVDPTVDVAEPGTLAYVTSRDPNELPDFLQQPYKMMSQYAVQGSDSMTRAPEYLTQYRDPRMQEMLQNAQRDYFHDNYYEPSEFPGMGEDFMTRYEVNVNELTLPMKSLLAEPDQPGPSHR